MRTPLHLRANADYPESFYIGSEVQPDTIRCSHTIKDFDVATVRPFRGFRPQQEFASRVASRPYDVLTTEEARQEAAGNPLSFLRIGKAEIELPLSIDQHDPKVYTKAAENLQRFVKEGILRQERDPCLYLYGLAMGGHEQYGIVASVSVDDYKTEVIRRHELTRPDKEDDRTHHIDVTGAHTGPVLMAYRSTEGIEAIVERVRKTLPVIDFIAPDSIRHQLWVVDDQRTVSALTQQFSQVARLYIADGHHRSAAAARVAALHASRNPSHTGNEEYNYFLGVLFPQTQLRILGYNRTVSNLNGRTPEEFLEVMRSSFDCIEALSGVTPEMKGEFGMYLKGHWYRFHIHADPAETVDPVASLDVSLLQNHVLGPLLEIRDPRSDTRIDFVGGMRGSKELMIRVDSGIVAVAFSVHPTSMEELLRIADVGKIMPPKSTWFEPKLRDGMVVHFLQ
jgi:uncharacterized protein (DUF1015 family)